MNMRRTGFSQRALACVCLFLLYGAGNIALAVTPQIRLGYDHALLLKNDGTVWQWGTTDYGTNKTSDNRSCYAGNTIVSVPVQVMDLASVVSIATTGEYSIALLSDGTVRQWGRDPLYPRACIRVDSYHELWQIKDASDSTTFLTHIVAIWAGNESFFARRSDGTVMAWGANGFNKLGVKAPTINTNPPPAVPPSAVANIAEPLLVVRLSNPVANTWPPQVPKQIVAGGTHALALMLDNSVRAWGALQYGERGDGTMGTSSYPHWDGHAWYDLATNTAIDNVSRLAAGIYKSAAVKGDGSVWVWGCNQYGELGNAVAMGTNAQCASLPVQVTELSGAADIAMGDSHTTVLLDNGDVKTMGYNGNYALGAPVATIRSQTPFQVGVSGISAIDAEGDCSIALKQDGTIWQWGKCPGGSGLPTQVAVAGTSLAPACGPATEQSVGAQPKNGLCLVGQSSAVTGNGPWGWSCSLSGSTVNCAASAGPTFLLQPTGGRYFPGRTITLRVIAEGKAPLTYQWFKKTANGDVALTNRRGRVTKLGSRSSISGATTLQMTIGSLVAADGGNYFVEVKDVAGVASRSQNASVDVMTRRPKKP